MNYLPNFEGKVAAITFAVSSLSLVTLASHAVLLTVAIEVLYVLFLLALLWLTTANTIRVVIIAHLLGILFGVGLSVILQFNGDEIYVGVYMMVLSFFHLSEYVVTSIHNPGTLTLNSFLINHSIEYGMAAALSWIEYLIEYLFIPWIKSYWYISWIGIILIVFGESLRKLAMLTAKANFNHTVQYYKRYNHQLVTSGVYGIARHPSYVGWFYWSIGTQLLLCNPVCIMGYTIASWLFFKDRIQVEEEYLVHFFGQEYIDYQKQVGTGLPFISGLTGYNNFIKNN